MGTSALVQDRSGLDAASLDPAAIATDAAATGAAPLEAAATEAAEPSPLVSKRSQNIPYLVGIDHLRGGAALLILYYHGVQLFSSQVAHGRMFKKQDWPTAPDPVSALVAEGHTAVSLFIVLSGFIFAFGATGRQITYRQFLLNRFLRTYPLLIFLVIVGIAVAPKKVAAAALLQTLLGGANLQGAQSLGNFSLMFWTVSLEWQLYLLFPALMLLLNRKGASKLLLMVGAIGAARGIAFLQGLHPVNGLYTQLLGRLDQFVLGMLAGWLYANHRGHRALRYVLIPAAVGVLGSAYVFNHLGGWPQAAWWRLATPTLEGLLWACFALGYVAYNDRREQRPGLLSRALIAVGTLSYSTYLWHFLLLQIQRSRAWIPRWLDQPDLNAALVVTLTTLPVTLLVATLSYQAIEKPFMSLRKRYVVASSPSGAAVS